MKSSPAKSGPKVKNSSATRVQDPAPGPSGAQPSETSRVESSRPGLRQRATSPPSAPSPASPPISTPVPPANPAPQQNQSENPFVILLMVALGLAILALLARRVYMMNLWRFDTDF